MNDSTKELSAEATYDASFVSEAKDLAAICLWVVTVFGLVLDLLALKWLRTASFLFYLELLHAAITAMFPYSNGIGSSQLIIILALASSICLFCDPLPNLIYLIVVVTWLAFGQLPLVYGHDLDGTYVWESICLIFVTIAVFAAVTMMVTDSARAKKHLEVLETDDFNLLNNMQEGLFVLNS